MLDFEMELRIKFNREIQSDIDYISPGGFEMIMNGREVGFDFYTHYGYIDKHEPTRVEFCFEEPDADAFEILNEITIDDLKNVTKITECFVYVGEDSDLKEVEIESIAFYIPVDDDEPLEIVLSDEIIKEYNKNLSEKRV